MSDNRPIAIIDSGAGGLSVLSEIKKRLPKESYFYFGDTLNLPYGAKTAQEIERLTIKACLDVVRASECKLLVLACHTMSVLCKKLVADIVDVPVIDMFTPTLARLGQKISIENISSLVIISTNATLKSGAYRNVWPVIDPLNRCQLIERPGSHLVNLIEEVALVGAEFSKRVKDVLPEEISDLDAVLLGCTHFNAIKAEIRAVSKPSCHIIDPAEFVADEVRDYLTVNNLKASSGEQAFLKAYVSDNPTRFQIIAVRFMDEKITAEKSVFATALKI